jgi:hypothetical protein
MGERRVRDYDADDMPAHGASPKAPDGQPSNPTGGQHPSDHRRRERAAEGVEVHHHQPTPADDAHAQHMERLRHHGATPAHEHGDDGHPRRR